MSTTRRWMTSAIETAKADAPPLPYQRGRRKPLAERRAEAGDKSRPSRSRDAA